MVAPDSRSTASGPSRRTLLGAAGPGAGAAVLLAGCGAPGSATETAGPDSPVDVGAVEEIPVGSGVLVDQGGIQAVVGRPAPDTVTAFSPVCPHQGCMVAPREERYVCPCHASVFDLATGDVLTGPAQTGLEAVPAAVRDGRVLLG